MRRLLTTGVTVPFPVSNISNTLDNYNLAITFNAPFVTCNSDSLPSGNPAPLMESLDQALCGADACNYDEDTPECDRQARSSTEYYIKLKGQNTGSGGRPRCGPVVVCCHSPCRDPLETKLTQVPGWTCITMCSEPGKSRWLVGIRGLCRSGVLRNGLGQWPFSRSRLHRRPRFGPQADSNRFIRMRTQLPSHSTILILS